MVNLYCLNSYGLRGLLRGHPQPGWSVIVDDGGYGKASNEFFLEVGNDQITKSWLAF